MSAGEKYTTLNEKKIPAVYEAGKRAGQDDLWLGILNTRKNFEGQFKDWQLEYMRPPIKIELVAKGSANQTFRGNALLKIVEAAYVDFSQLETGSSNTEGIYYTFYNCSSLEEVEDIGIGAVNDVYGFSNTFNNCSNLHTIGKLTIAASTRLVNVFNYCSSLANIDFAGIIGTNGLNFQWSPLSHDSLMSIINALDDKSADTSGTAWTVTLGEDNLAKLTADEQKIAKDKGWNLA